MSAYPDENFDWWIEVYYSNTYQYWYVDRRDHEGGDTILRGFKTEEDATEAAHTLELYMQENELLQRKYGTL